MSRPTEHPALELIRRRVSADEFDPDRGLSEDEVRSLVADAIRAPSSFNIQHWRFIAVRDADGKKRLRRAAFDQRHVADAAVTFVVLGDLQALERFPAIMETAVAAGALPAKKAIAWVTMAREIYADLSLARDEAIRSASLAAMTMMLAAEARGWATCALTGFDPSVVSREFEIDPRYLPVMLLAVGHPRGAARPRMPRLPVDQVLAFDRWCEPEEPGS